MTREAIGSNEFYTVGPKDDPAGIAGAKGAANAYGERLHNYDACAKQVDH